MQNAFCIKPGTSLMNLLIPEEEHCQTNHVTITGGAQLSG